MSTNKSGSGEPIAVIGMACRFPLANNLAAFWQLLKEGKNAVIEGEPGSGEGRIGKMFRDANVPDACRFYAFTDAIDEFDAGFFRISPAEADLLDPQQRMLLEVSWHALENAGIDLEQLLGSRTGVYGGVASSDYRWLAMPASLAANPAAKLHAVIGNSGNAAIGRVSYVFGLRGPAVTVDTACSSSLVAVHQAVVGLQGGEADLALAGGVNAIIHGDSALLRGAAGLTAKDGRCKTFDAAANGYVRGEGCGMLVLKRLRDAEADGDLIWGVIRGSAVNQDGASEGLAVPNGVAQVEVIKAALYRAGVTPTQVDYAEAHGTGTVVGDPIELRALAEAYRDDRDAHPLLIGSVKTNFGHLEAAAGIAGMIKVLLAMRQGLIPKHLNFNTPTPAVDWQQLPLQVTANEMTWPHQPNRNPLASINSFGWSGTNAHVVLEGYGELQDSMDGFCPPKGKPQQVALPAIVTTQAPVARHTRILPLSGKTQGALQELARCYLSWLNEHETSSASLPDIAWTASVGRGHFAHRAGIVFRDNEELRAGLQAVIENNTITEHGRAKKIAFVYTGQGSQWIGMGKTLYEQEPVVRAVLDKCDAVAVAERQVSLLDVMFGKEGAPSLDDTVWAQPAIYALECALTSMWSSLGVRPDVLMGHSLGEFAAMQAAGVYDVEAGMRFVLNRSTALAAVPEAGMMAAVFAPVEEVETAVREHNAATQGLGLSIAAYNVVQQVVSGPTAAVEALAERLEARGITVKRMKNQAFHCPLVEPAVASIAAAHEALRAKQPATLMISNVTGEALDKVDAEYWRRHTVDAVEFRKGIEKLAALEVDLVIELGPHAVLGTLVTMAWPSTTGDVPPTLSSLLRPSSERPLEMCEDAFLLATTGAYTAGVAVDFKGLYAGETRCRVMLPDYPFQRQRYWVSEARPRTSTGHPLLGERRESASGEITYENEMTPMQPSWLQDHRVFGRVVMPGAVYGAMAISAALSDKTKMVAVEDVQLHRAMIFPALEAENEASLTVQLVLDKSEQQARPFKIYSRSETGGKWQLHAAGQLAQDKKPKEEQPPLQQMDKLKAAMQPRDLTDFYRTKAEANIDFGAMFRPLTSLWSSEGEALGELSLQADDRMALHPTLLDGCFQVLSAARPPSNETYMPFGWERLWVTGTLPERIVCHARVRESAADRESDKVAETLRGDLWFYSTEGMALGGLHGFTVKRARREALLAEQKKLGDMLYEVEWVVAQAAVGDSPTEVPTPAGCWVLVADRGGVAVELAAELVQRKQKVVLVGDEGGEDGNITRISIDTEDRTAWHTLLKGLPTEVPLMGVVHLAALDGHGAQASTEEMGRDTKRVVASALALGQGVLDAGLTPAQGVHFITRGAQVLEQERLGELAGAALWGVGKTIANEASHLKPKMIDLDPRDTGLPSYLVNELLFPDQENHIAYRNGDRKVARLVRLGTNKSRLVLPQDSSWRLMPDPHGTLAGLRVEPLPDYKLGANEVRIAVDAASLNFKDVMISLGLINIGDPIGSDACGRVLEVGDEVTEIAVGDRVVTQEILPLGKFASEAISRQELVVPVPTDMPTEALAAVPVCFTTAAIAFDSADLKAGECVLIHAATGGVGQAAIQLAHALGVEVYATASAAKQGYLRSLGVSHVFDSRSTRFGEEILAATDGKGVQVVLNSLTSEGFIEASLSCLAKGGRFVEIGRSSIWGEEEMNKVRPDIAYTVISLDKMQMHETDRVRVHFKDVMQRLCSGELKPPDYSLWSFTEAREAMEFMHTGRHTGKQVLTMPPLRNGKLRADRTYLVTGGLGGISLAVAEWLVDNGAGAIVLNARRQPDAATEEKLAALRQRGVTLQVELADVTDSEAVDAMLARIDTSLPPLAGVIHSVGVLHDAALTNQSWETFEKVLSPKVMGAWHLHRATKNLDMFIVFTSVAGIIGTRGQANHAAANAFLDQLVAHRRALGLPGMAIAWGAWSDLGEAEEHRERLKEKLAARGSSWITPQQGIKAFAHLLQQNLTNVLVWPVDWQGFASSYDNRPPLVENMLSSTVQESASTVVTVSPDNLPTQLQDMTKDEYENLLVLFIQQELQASLRLSTPPSPSASFIDLGMDSLMAVEVGNRLNRALAGKHVVSSTVMFDYPNVKDLAHHLAEELGKVDL